MKSEKADPTRLRRRRIRELAEKAYERELSRELAALEGDFARWRRGDIDAHELSDRIHRFHQGPNRGLFLAYNAKHLDFAVAVAIARGILTEEEAGPEVVSFLARSIESARRDIETRNADDGGD